VVISTVRRGVAVAMAATMAVMIVDNVVTGIDVQRTLPCDQRLCTSPRDLEQWTRSSPNPRMSAQLSIFYLFRERIPHTAIVVPPWMFAFQWNFRTLSRMTIVPSPRYLYVDDAAIEELKTRATLHRMWMRRGGSAKRILLQDLWLRIEPGARAYVWAETSSSYFGPIFLLPLEDYARYADKAPR